MAGFASPKDKVVLAVSFLAILATMYGYKESLIYINVFSSYTLFDLLTYMSALFCGSIYFSALANLRFIHQRLTERVFFKYLEYFSDFLYFFALIGLPTIFLVGYILNMAASKINNILLGISFISISSEKMMLSANIISAIIGVLSSIIGTYLGSRRKIEERDDRYKEK